MTWAALFERAEAYEVDEAAVLEVLSARRRSGGGPPGEAGEDP